MTLRFDRLASVYLASPLVQGTPDIPILMYHSIADENEAEVHPYFRVAVPPALFASQMQYLRDQGYSTCSLADIFTPTTATTDIPGKKVVITFDDGYANFYTEAFPVLQRFGFTATMFLPTAYIDDSALPFNQRECLTWRQVRELQQHGITIGSHTVSHPQLHNLCKTLIRHELLESKNIIEDQISSPVNSFSYPYAFPQADKPFQTMLQEFLSDAGYTHGVCTAIGRAGAHSDPLFLPRLPVNGSDDTDLLHAKLIGGYDWVGWPQFMLKRIHGLLTEVY